MTTYPTEAAWDFFCRHHDAIRACCEQFLPESTIKSMAGDVPAKPESTIADFDAAVTAQDTGWLCGIMNSAWLRAPEDRSVYQIDGFQEMCALLDFSVEGFTDPGVVYEDEDEPAF